MVKLSVPFLFLFFRRSCRTRAAPAAQERAEQTRMPPPARRKREYGMEESDLLQKVCQPWLDLTNLAVTTGYHSLSWLSSPDLKFPEKIFAALLPAKKSPGFVQGAGKALPPLCKIHCFPLAFWPDACYYNTRLTGRVNCLHRRPKPIRPQKAATRAAFQRLNS